MSTASIYRLSQLVGSGVRSVAVYVCDYVENADGTINYSWGSAIEDASKLSRKRALRAADLVEKDQAAWRIANKKPAANPIRVRAVTGGEELSRHDGPVALR